eukprot:2416467-Prymnesium_polylepis.1
MMRLCRRPSPGLCAGGEGSSDFICAGGCTCQPSLCHSPSCGEKVPPSAVNPPRSPPPPPPYSSFSEPLWQQAMATISRRDG